jgi:hypothetical protein
VSQELSRIHRERLLQNRGYPTENAGPAAFVSEKLYASIPALFSRLPH